MNLQETAKAKFARLETDSSPYLDRGRECAKLTLPALLPPSGSTGSTKLPTPFQSTGARGVNNLASRLLLAILPAGSSFFRIVIDDFLLEQMTGKEGMRANIEESLDRMERAVMGEIEASDTRASVFEAMKHLIVAGNVLVFVPPEGGLKVYRMDRYVVKRDPMGNVLEGIVRENVSALALPDKVRAQVLRDVDPAKAAHEQDAKELFTHIYRTDKGWEIYQEIDGIRLAGSDGTYPPDKCPWLFLRFIKMDGEDYGRGYVEEYLGDLKTLEGLSKAIVQASAAAAKVLFLVRPNATTKIRTLAESESGDIREGNAQDVSVLQMDKFADLRVAKETITELKEALSYAFLLNSAIQRKGERVTAEEIRYMAQELEAVLGGIYSSLAQEFQLPFITVKMAQMESKGRLPKLPKDSIKPTITTGIEAIGRGSDLSKLSGLLQDIAVFGPEVIAKNLNVSDYIKRAGAARGIDMKGLIPTPEEIAQREQQEQMMSLTQQLGPNAINQMGKMGGEEAPAA